MENIDSVLISVKLSCGVDPEDQNFDGQLAMHTNSVISSLGQLMSGLKAGFIVLDETASWSELFGDLTDVEFIKTYVGLKVKQIFDPSGTAALIDATAKLISELEFRIVVSEDQRTYSQTISKTITP